MAMDKWRVLAVGCHPDDIEVACAGTLARYRQLGHEVILCHLCNGDMGHKVIDPDTLKSIRTREAEASGTLIGAEVLNGGIGDLTLYADNKATRDKVVDLIRYARPDIILTHSPEDYMPDHVATGKLVFDASFTATLPHYETALPFHPVIPPIYYMDTLAGVNFLPAEYVDISMVITDKLEALNCHHSQIDWMRDHDHIDFLDFVETCSKYRGLQCGVRYAEGFQAAAVWPRLPVRRLLP